MCCLEIEQLLLLLLLLFLLKNASFCSSPLHVPDRRLLSDFYFLLIDRVLKLLFSCYEIYLSMCSLCC